MTTSSYIIETTCLSCGQWIRMGLSSMNECSLTAKEGDPLYVACPCGGGIKIEVKPNDTTYYVGVKDE